MHSDLVVIGGGPGGYTAAFLAADLGMQVAIVEQEPRLGGVCLLRGCIPSKALLHVARVLSETREMAEWGLDFTSPAIDVDKLRGRKENVIRSLSDGLAQLAKRRGVKVVRARATFEDSQRLGLETGDPKDPYDAITFKHAILAAGSSPAMPKAFQLGTDRVMDSTGALELTDLPQRLLVVGGGYIGLEMGTVYAELGSKVTVVEMLDGLLPGADRDLVKPLAKRLGGIFENIFLETKVAGMKDLGAKIEVTFEGKAKEGAETFDRVLVSIGRRPNSEGLGLEKTEAELGERGFVVVDEQMRTADPAIYAIGDICGEPMLAHKAMHEARVAVEAIGGEPVAWDKVAIPAVVFTDPEIAWVGLTEAEAKREGREVSVAQYPWAASGRAVAVGRTEGLTKMIVDPRSERILGVGICGVNAGEMIAEATLALEMGCTVRDITETIHTHPTLSETVGNAGEVFFGLATEVYRPRRDKKPKPQPETEEPVPASAE